jgi:hypothetical protein
MNKLIWYLVSNTGEFVQPTCDFDVSSAPNGDWAYAANGPESLLSAGISSAPAAISGEIVTRCNATISDDNWDFGEEDNENCDAGYSFIFYHIT